MATEELQEALPVHGLTVSSIPGKGRGLVATKDFAPGDVIISEEAYASTPNKIFGSCDGCLGTNNVRKCSACRIACYCGSMCQKSEWKLHREECQALAELSEERKKKLTPTIRLMMRLLIRRKLQNEQVIPSTPTDNYALVDTLVSHTTEVDEKELVLYAQMATLVNLVLPSSDMNIKEITEVFSKLSCNAHTICDSELRPVGTGLYPITSIINHSCMPNSVLMFEGRVAFVRAMECITKGSEVSISYIETAASTKMRQKDLEQYFFTCKCSRCTKGSWEELQEDAIMEGHRCKDDNCNGFLLHDSEKRIFTCQQCGCAREQQEIEKLDSKVEELSERASDCLASGNCNGARITYQKLEQLQLKLCHPFSIDLLRTRETLLKILMELKDWCGALTYCRLTIQIYHRVYPRIHPMLGLQYYTCGKLEWLLEYTENALDSFTKAVEILEITHGTKSPFMKGLRSSPAPTSVLPPPASSSAPPPLSHHDGSRSASFSVLDQMFNDLKAQILASQPSDQQQRLSLCFDKLTADVTGSLDSKNRDKFTQNLTIFRHDFRVK